MTKDICKRLGGLMIWLGCTLALGTYRAALGVADPVVAQTVGYVLGVVSAIAILIMTQRQKAKE